MMEYPVYYYHHRNHENESKPEENSLRIQRRPSQNIVNRLLGREMWGNFRKPNTRCYVERKMHQSIVPNFSVKEVKKPRSVPRKFTPDGKYMIAVSIDCLSFEIYAFQGTAAGNHLFQGMGKKWLDVVNPPPPPPPAPKKRGRPKKVPVPATSAPSAEEAAKKKEEADSKYRHFDFVPHGFPDHIRADEMDAASQTVRNNLFSTLFKLKSQVTVTAVGQHLNTECMLFTQDHKYMLIGSSNFVLTNETRAFLPLPDREIMDNESMVSWTDPNYRLLDYTLSLVDIELGRITDSIEFNSDRINLAFNHGVYLYDKTLAVLSFQYQRILIYRVDNGIITPVQTIGRFCLPGDEMLYAKVPEFSRFAATREAFMTSFRQRLMSHLFRRMSAEKATLGMFHNNYDYFCTMKMWKMQLLDEDHLLIRFTPLEISLRDMFWTTGLRHGLYAVYSVSKAEIITMLENSEEDVLAMCVDYSDYFINALVPGGQFVNSTANNIHSRDLFERFHKKLIETHEGLNPRLVMQKLLSTIPMSAQSHTPSPYLDCSLFSYDNTKVSELERPKQCVESPLRFYGRDTLSYRFQIHGGLLPENQENTGWQSKVVFYLFHPTEPFLFTVQKTADSSEYFVNIHSRIDPYSVMPM